MKKFYFLCFGLYFSFLVNPTLTFSGVSEDEARKIIQSISTYGIQPYHLLSKKAQDRVSPVFILGTSLKAPEISVNYVNLESRTEEEVRDAVHIAVFEETRGIFGIAHERVWPLHSPLNALGNAKDQAAGLQEFSDRLSSTLVFILTPPQELRKLTQKEIDESEIFQKMEMLPGTSLAFYSLYSIGHNDGLYQGRGRCLDEAFLSNSQIKKTNAIVEIKTQLSFPYSSIQAILSPTKYLDEVNSVFAQYPRIKIIEVQSRPTAVNKVSDFLEIFYKESFFKKDEIFRVDPKIYSRYQGPVQWVSAPDYEDALMKLQSSEGKVFSIHAVRLPTKYDFSVRFIENSDSSEELLKKIKASVLQQYPSGAAWVAVNKVFTTDFSDSGLFGLSNTTDAEFFRKIRENFQDFIPLLEDLKKAKGDFLMAKVKGGLTDAQKEQLTQEGAFFTPCLEDESSDMVAFLKSSKSQISKIIK